MNENIAYLIGALNSDGHQEIRQLKDRIRYRMRFHVGEKSLPMLSKLQQIFRDEFNRKNKIQFLRVNEYGTKEFRIELSFKKLLPLFEKLEIKKGHIPTWIVNSQKLFCSYLAGLIDGDGTVCIKRKKTYPQCAIRIIDGKRSEELEICIEDSLNCGCWIEPVKRDASHFPTKNEIVAYRHCFYVSRKNREIFKNLVLPYIQIKQERSTNQLFKNTIKLIRYGSRFSFNLWSQHFIHFRIIEPTFHGFGILYM